MQEEDNSLEDSPKEESLESSQEFHQSEEPLKAPIAKAHYSELHRADNTTALDPVEDPGEFIKELTEEEIEDSGSMSYFLGSSKKEIDATNELIERYLTMTAVLSSNLEDPSSTPDSLAEKQKAEWKAYCSNKFPNLTVDEVESVALSRYVFLTEQQDGVKVRSKVVREPNVTSVFDRGSVTSGDIVGKRASLAKRSSKVSERMLRAVTRGKGEDLNFDVLLRNSFVSLTFTKPNKLEMGSLISSLAGTVKGYVRVINNNSIKISNTAAKQVIWEFLSKRIVKSSVNDIGDFGELATVIRDSDFDTLVIALLTSFSSRGAPMTVACLEPSCNSRQHKLVDISKLSKIRNNILTPEIASIHTNLINGTVSYTKEETLALQAKADYNLKTDRVFNLEKTIYLRVGSPLLSEVFRTFEYFIGMVNLKIGEKRTLSSNKDELSYELDILYSQLSRLETLHWVKEFVTVDSNGNQEDNDVISRSDEVELGEFDEGIYESLLTDNYLASELTKFIHTHSPYMSYTFVGIRNYVCKSCNKDQGDLHNLGYTPINAVTSFFSYLRLLNLIDLGEGAKLSLEVQ